jgi:hypothetical protein
VSIHSKKHFFLSLSLFCQNQPFLLRLPSRYFPLLYFGQKGVGNRWTFGLCTRFLFFSFLSFSLLVIIFEGGGVGGKNSEAPLSYHDFVLLRFATVRVLFFLFLTWGNRIPIGVKSVTRPFAGLGPAKKGGRVVVLFVWRD